MIWFALLQSQQGMRSADSAARAGYSMSITHGLVHALFVGNGTRACRRSPRLKRAAMKRSLPQRSCGPHLKGLRKALPARL